ncbi:FG-GAP repeat domain-containing protein [Marinicella rhabdoformis]|uniref:FG-GAP repeat domain-containing protein n=1 Tax=Marinicella rhabdoformis TaxID=2580566 RepID=UPI0012AEDD07|nr:VCBS repeat-containing protein [Marinicella rhabdoformis]
MNIKHLMLLIVTVLHATNHAHSQAKENPPVIDVSHQWEVTNIHGPSQVGIVDSITVDLNSDGLIDVVSISIDDGSIRAYLNHGQAVTGSDLNFPQQIIDENEVGLYRIISKDLNDDNRPDLIATNVESQKIISYVQQIDGSFIKVEVAVDILLPTDVGAGDFNGDGRMDLVSLSFENSEVYQHSQQIDGSFETSVIATDFLRPRKLSVADWNQDGFLDVAVASQEDSSVRILFNKSQVGWSERLLTGNALGTRNLTACDLDSNGLQDVVVSHTDENALVAYYNFGSWPYSPKIIDDAALAVNAVLCQDLNNNGEMDLAAIYAQTGNIYSYFQNQGFTPNLVANTRDGYITLDAADFNHNQQPQILTQAHFQQRNLIYQPQAQNEEQVIWQDFPDGLLDISINNNQQVAFGAFKEGSIYIFKNNIEFIYKGIKGTRGVLFEEVENEEQLYSLNSESGTVFRHKKKKGKYYTTIEASGLSFPVNIDKLELGISKEKALVVVSTFEDNLLLVLPNELKTIPVNVYGSFAIDVADMNGDKLSDIVLSDYINGDIVVLIQSEAVGFVKSIISSNKETPYAVHALDIDQDGDMDVLSTATFANEIWLHENQNGKFKDYLVSKDISRPRMIDSQIKNGRVSVIISSLAEDGGVYLIKPLLSKQFHISKVVQSKSGNHAVKFLGKITNELSFLAGGHVQSSLKQYILRDLIYKDSFEL